MKKMAIIYGDKCEKVPQKAIELLGKFLLDYTEEYPIAVAYERATDYSEFRCIYIGTKLDHSYINEYSKEELTDKESYYISVKNDNIVLEGFDDAGLLYACVDFYNKYIVKYEYTYTGSYCTNPFVRALPDFELTSAPSIKDRGIWTWGHTIYDYKGFLDNMLLCKMNTVIIWNDFAPINAKEIVDYAHANNIKVFFGYPWCWDVDCGKFLKTNIFAYSKDIFEKFEKEYSSVGMDGIYFQSFTELTTETIDGVLIADAVTSFVNKTAELFYEKYPEIELQFGLHATSVKNRLEYISKVDPRIRIVWEDCGAFPFSYYPSDVKTFDETLEFSKQIAVLRGMEDKFGAVTKGFTKLDWGRFEHLKGAVLIGEGTKDFKNNRIVRKRRIWKYLQAFWLINSDKALEMMRQLSELKNGELMVTALVEDGMFEENMMFAVALYAEILWDTNSLVDDLMSNVALRDNVTFA